MTDTSLSDYAIVLWLAATAVAALTAHLGLGWLARARRQASFVEAAGAQLVSAAVLGTGACASAILAVLADGLHFAIGFGAVAAIVIWMGAIIGSIVLVAGLTYSSRWWMVLLAALGFAALGAGLQVAWVWAAGFRPGVLWNWPLVATGASIIVIGGLIGLSASGMQGSRRQYDAQRLVRRGASLLLGLSLMAGQQITLSAADLGSQKGSVYRNQVPGVLIGVGCGVLVPLTFLMLSVDLSLRNHRRQRSLSQFKPEKRRKRRHRIRTL